MIRLSAYKNSFACRSNSSFWPAIELLAVVAGFAASRIGGRQSANRGFVSSCKQVEPADRVGRQRGVVLVFCCPGRIGRSGIFGVVIIDAKIKESVDAADGYTDSRGHGLTGR